MQTSYRDDARWQNARRRYVDKYGGITADEAFTIRMMAAFDMHAIEEGRQPQFGCPYCSLPDGWDACPIHRDGE